MSGGHGARLFFAVAVPEAVRRELAAWARRSAGGARVLDPGSLHLTLLFLGSRAFEEVDELAGSLARAARSTGACELSLGAPLWLPPRRPRALAVEVHDAGAELARLQEALVRDAGAAEQAPDGRRVRFRPHITVARAGAAPGAQARLPREFPVPTPQLTFAAARAVLYRSFLERSGARYEALAEADIGAAA